MVSKENLLGDDKAIFEILVVGDPYGELISSKPLGIPSSTTNPVGFFYNLDEAIETVENNYGDIWETVNDGAFIVARNPGLYQSVDKSKRMYFEFNKEKRMYEQKTEPTIWKNITL